MFGIFFTITHIHLAYPYLASDKPSCTEVDKDADSFLQLMEAATLWNEIKMNFITRISEGRNKYRHRLEVEQCWPDDMNGIPNAQQNAQRATPKKQQKQKYMDYSPRGLKPNDFQLKARKQLMDCPNATWNDFSTHNIQEDALLQVCSNFLHDVEHIKNKLATLRQEMRNLRTELQEHRVNCMEKIFRQWARTPQKRNQKTVRFCNYCHEHGHTPEWCGKKMRDEEKRRVQHNMSFNKNIAPIREYGTSDSNCRSEYDRNVDRCLDSDDVNIPTNKFLTTEDETCQEESDDGIKVYFDDQWHELQNGSIQLSWRVWRRIVRPTSISLLKPSRILFLYCYLIPFVYFYIP